MPPRTVALIGAVCLTTGWLLASLLTPPVARVQVLPERRAVPSAAQTESLTPYSEQLHFKLRQAPVAPTPRRNPFAFGGLQRAEGDAPTQSRTGEARAEAPVPPPVVGPMFSLSGIGVSRTPEGVVHTAILSDDTTVHLVKAGDTVGGYKVVEVTESTITLQESNGSQHTLRLR